MDFLEQIFGYKEKTVVITGGGGILAGFIAEGFLQAGARVSLWGRSQASLDNAS